PPFEQPARTSALALTRATAPRMLARRERVETLIVLLVDSVGGPAGLPGCSNLLAARCHGCCDVLTVCKATESLHFLGPRRGSVERALVLRAVLAVVPEQGVGGAGRRAEGVEGERAREARVGDRGFGAEHVEAGAEARAGDAVARHLAQPPRDRGSAVVAREHGGER